MVDRKRAFTYGFLGLLFAATVVIALTTTFAAVERGLDRDAFILHTVAVGLCGVLATYFVAIGVIDTELHWARTLRSENGAYRLLTERQRKRIEMLERGDSGITVRDTLPDLGDSALREFEARKRTGWPNGGAA